MGRGIWRRRERRSPVRHALVLAALLVPSVVSTVALDGPASARAGVTQYIGESYDMDLLYNPASQMCVGQQSQLAVQITQFGVYIDPDGNHQLVQRANGNLANGGVIAESSNPAVVSLTLLTTQLSGTQVMTYSVTALKAGTSRLSFTYTGTGITGPLPFKMVNSQVDECDYKVDTASMWHIVDSRQNIVALTVVHTMLEKTSESPAGVYQLEKPGGGFSAAEHVASAFKPPCVGTYTLPDTDVYVDGVLNTTTHKVSVEMRFGDVPVQTAVTCIIPSGGNDDVSELGDVNFEVRASGGSSSKVHVLVAKKLGSFSGLIFYTVKPIPR
jgi:hypothetical protein